MADIRPARLVDIAAEVGVHPSVVSRTLSKDPTLNIRDETRALIFETASRLGYRGNSAARRLKGAIAGAIAVVTPSLRNPVSAEIVRGALHAAENNGMALLLSEMADGSTEVGSFVRLVEEGRIDGLLIGASGPVVDHEGWPPSGVPTVHVNRAAAGASINVVLDEALAISIPLMHLIALGHRRITLLEGPAAIDTVRRRTEAARSVAAEHSLQLTVVNHEFDEAGGHLGMRLLLESNRESMPTAVIVSNFTQVVGALAALRESPMQVPADISIVCLDDDPLLDYLDVSVTSVRMPLYELGKAATETLIARIRGQEASSSQVDSPMALVQRSSTAIARN